MARPRPKSRVDLLVDSLTSLRESTAALNEIDLRRGCGVGRSRSARQWIRGGMSASQPVGRPGSWGGGVPLLFFLLIGVCSESEQSPIVCSRYSSSPLPWLLFSVFRVKALGDVVLVQHGGLG